MSKSVFIVMEVSAANNLFTEVHSFHSFLL